MRYLFYLTSSNKVFNKLLKMAIDFGLKAYN